MPAPASTWTGSPLGNWDLVHTTLYQGHPDKNTLPAPHSETQKIIRAALATTLNHWLPEVLETLSLVSFDAKLANKTIVWHGNWYLSPSCKSKTADLPGGVFLYGNTDAWTLYHNTQVYMQNRLLGRILLAYDILYLPAILPQTLSWFDDHVKFTNYRVPLSQLPDPRSRASCGRYPLVPGSGQTFQDVFLDSLRTVLSAEVDTPLI